MKTKFTLIFAGLLGIAAFAFAPAKAAPLAGAFAPDVAANLEPVLHRCVRDGYGRVVCGRICPNGRIAPDDFCGYGYYGYYRPYRHRWWW
jgi:hypothetical protein